MSSRRTLILIAAVAIGAISAFMVWQYVGGIQDRAYDDAARVPVFVVRTEVLKGVYGEETRSEKSIVADEIPKKFYPPNAIRDLKDIEGKQAINNLAANQIVTTDMFADPAVVQSSFADRLDKINEEQQVTTTFSVDEIRGVAGLLQPGDFVNVLVEKVCARPEGAAEPAPIEPAPEGAAAEDAQECDETKLFDSQARYLYQKAEILAIGKTPVPQAGEVTAAAAEGDAEGAAAPDPEALGDVGLVTLIVPAQTAQYIASVHERVYLSLVGDDYVPDPDLGPIDPEATLPAEDPTQLTPYGADGADDEK